MRAPAAALVTAAVVFAAPAQGQVTAGGGEFGHGVGVARAWAPDAQAARLAGRVPDTVQNAEGVGRFRPLAVAKWGLLAGSAATATWGVLEARRADDAYTALEARCAADEETCTRRQPSGAYENPALEADYQAVVRRDRRAGRALLAGEVGFAATVVLFVLDLRNAGPPETIPYEPRLRVLPAGDGGIHLRMSFRGVLR